MAGDEPFTSGPIVYSMESRAVPRPLVIHRLTIDLQAPEFQTATRQFEWAVSMGTDPDGEGPLEATLTPPSELALRERLFAAVNTNAWVMSPKPAAGNGYVAGGTTDVSGWVRIDGLNRSFEQPGHWSLWIDNSGLAHVGETSKTDDVRCAVSGFRGLLNDGRILPEANDVRHPRTAAGIDRLGQHVTLLVVDGRQKGYSEGVSEQELAGLMIESGCDDAINLDGGGSTVMLLGDRPDSLKVMNRPSDAVGPRPVPVMLGIRRASPDAVR